MTRRLWALRLLLAACGLAGVAWTDLIWLRVLGALGQFWLWYCWGLRDEGAEHIRWLRRYNEVQEERLQRLVEMQAGSRRLTRRVEPRGPN